MMHHYKQAGWIILLILVVGLAIFYDKKVLKINTNAQKETIIYAD